MRVEPGKVIMGREEYGDLRSRIDSAKAFDPPGQDTSGEAILAWARDHGVEEELVAEVKRFPHEVAQLFRPPLGVLIVVEGEGLR